MQNPLRAVTVFGATLALAGLGIAAPALAATSGPPSVLHMGQIGRQDVQSHGNCEPDTLVEPDIAVSPFNTKIEVAVAHDCRFATGGAVDIFYAWTHDGGAHWHQSRLPGLTRAVGGTYDRASDPVVAFGADGSVYVSSLVFDVTCPTAVAVSRSTDGGATFGLPVLAQHSNTCAVSDDKNWLVTDTQPNSPFYGRIYQFWTEFLANGTSPQVVRWSDNEGKTWSGTHVVDPKDFAQNSQPFVQPGGAITDTYLFAGHALGNGTRQGFILPAGTGTAAGSGVSIVARTSFDGGATWTKPAVVATNIGGGPAGIRCCLPMMSGDHVTGRMFQVWNANGPGTQDAVLVSRSADGQHWTSPVQVTPGHNPDIQYINAAVAVAAGRVFVSYGRRDLNKPNFIQQELTWSDNGGATFAPPIALGPPSNLKYAAVAGGKFPGDYTGLSATPARTAGAWCVSSKPPSPTAAFHQTLYAATLHT